VSVVTYRDNFFTKTKKVTSLTLCGLTAYSTSAYLDKSLCTSLRKLSW